MIEAGPDRGQAEVVGVALLIGVTVLSLGVLTAGVGVVVEANADAAATARVADGLTDLAGGRPAGEVRLPLGDGRLRVVDRTVRVVNGTDGTVVRSVETRGLVYTSGDRRTSLVAGGIVRGRGENARLTAGPSLTIANGTAVVGVTALGSVGTDAVDGDGRAAIRLTTDTTRRRAAADREGVVLAIETATPVAWERHLANRGIETDRTDVDGDGVPSVVVDPGDRRLTLVVVDLGLEVGGG